MELYSRRLILREFQETDYALFGELELHPETYFYESKYPDIEHIRKYLEKAKSDTQQNPRTRYCFAVIIQATNEFCGRVTLTLINETINEWEIGWAIHPDKWGQGFATEASRKLMEFAIKDLRAHRLVAFSHPENIASLKVMRKLGMHQEGLLRETRMVKEKWSDEVVFSILDREWI